MHKAGGIIALIAGILSVFSLAFTFFFNAADAVFAGADNAEATAGYLVGGFFVISAVIVLSIIILNTRGRVPAILLIAACVLALFNDWTGGFVSVNLAFALLGGLFALVRGPSPTKH